ncbi:MAG: trypsin-like peptidase domain-containing protein [Clostridia bacterium]|nr:trypsin-like peptidase domain-containing protein [Clostridia bacterium]
MKRNNKATRSIIALTLALILACVLVGSAVIAENVSNSATGVAGDANPAINVAAKNASSVVGVVTYTMRWSRQSGETTQMVGQGSGVVIADGYVLTNNHVIEDGNTFKIILPSGEYADAQLVGADSSTDLAVLSVDSDELVPVTIGSSSNLLVGSTAIAIGNPGGEVLANTVTSGIISALERTSVNTTNTTRSISYIQHDAPINNGNSGGGLFDYNGDLIGINTLKYSGSVYSSVSFEGLGFAIPVDTAYPVAMDLIQYGKVQRPQMGVTAATYEGPDEASANYPPASVCVYTVTANSPAANAGIQPYDFITEVDGVRVTTMAELTTQLDAHQPGDVVTLTIVRYDNAARIYANQQQSQSSSSSDSDSYGYGYSPFYDFFGGYGNYYYGGNSQSSSQYSNIGGTFSTITVDVTLEVLD